MDGGVSPEVQPHADLRACRRFRALFPLAYGVSYGFDGLLLAFYAAAGTIAPAVAAAYTAAGLASAAAFYALVVTGRSERCGDKYLALPQLAVATAVMLGFALLAPELGFFFLGTLFIVHGFGGLRLRWRAAALVWALTALGAAAVLALRPGVAPLPWATPAERWLAGAWFAATLGRLTALAVLASLWRSNAAHGRRELDAAMARLQLTVDALEVEKARAQSASRTKSQFLANMSHEIRTPMNGVLGIAEVLLETPLDERQQRYVRTIRGSGEALLRILDDILDFSRIEAGRLQLERVTFNLRDAVQEAVQALAARAQRKGLDLVWQIAPEVPAFVRSDPGRLRQVLLNLMGNAIKFTERGSVNLSVDCACDPSRPAGERCVLRFAVEDSGIGIEPAVQARLFQPFSQADGSTARRYGGTGLGLAVCRELVTLLDGQIGVQSEPGLGSTFWFTIAADREPLPVLPAVPAADAGAERCAGMRVLVAEDNEINQEYVCVVLRQAGCEVMLVGDGQGAVDACLERPFDVVVMDCHMPRLDGYEATRRIRTLQDAGRISRVPVIALTAHATEGARQACLAAGMDDYLSKPFKPAELLSLLQRWKQPATA